MSNKYNTDGKSEFSASDKTIASEEEEKLNDEKDRQQMMADSNYYRGEGRLDERLQKITKGALQRAAQRGLESGYEEQDWLEAEAKIDGVSQSGDSG